MTDLCLRIKNKDVERNDAFSLYDILPCRITRSFVWGGGGIGFNNFGRPVFGHTYYKLSFSNPLSGVEKKILKEINTTYVVYPKLTFPWDEGHEMYNFPYPYPTHGIYQIW